MNIRYGLIIAFCTVMIALPLTIMNVGFIEILLFTIPLVVGGYLIWLYLKNKKLMQIIEEELEPEKFISENEKNKIISKRPAHQNLCNLNMVVGLIELGKYEEAKSLLDKTDISNSNKIIKLTYSVNKMAYYICVKDYEKAKLEFDTTIINYKDQKISAVVAFSIDMNVAECEYYLNKSEETAKEYLEKLNYFEGVYGRFLKRRQRLNFLFKKANIFNELGDKEEALENYKLVAENGKNLHITTLASEKVEELE